MKFFRRCIAIIQVSRAKRAVIAHEKMHDYSLKGFQEFCRLTAEVTKAEHALKELT